MTVPTCHTVATRIGWIGTGVMGSSMCAHLLQTGYRITLQGRTKSKAKPLLCLDVMWAENPRAVAAESDWLFTIAAHVRDYGESRR